MLLSIGRELAVPELGMLCSGGIITGGNKGLGKVYPAGLAGESLPVFIRLLPAVGLRSIVLKSIKPGSFPYNVPVHWLGTVVAPVFIQLFVPAMISLPVDQSASVVLIIPNGSFPCL